MTHTAAAQASLEAVLKDEIVRMYQEVAENPTGEFHFCSRKPGSPASDRPSCRVSGSGSRRRRARPRPTA
jgi:hypothetical protein